MQRRHIELEPIHDRLVLDACLAAADDSHVEARSAHVGTDEGIIADEPAHISGAKNAADRSRDHRLMEPWMIDRGEAAEGKQRLHAIAKAVFLGGLLDAPELPAAAPRRIGFDEHAVEPRL